MYLYMWEVNISVAVVFPMRTFYSTKNVLLRYNKMCKKNMIWVSRTSVTGNIFNTCSRRDRTKFHNNVGLKYQHQ